MKKIYLLLTLCCALIACKKNNVAFTYAPTEPRAGAVVRFTNQSSSGEEWEWTFGDGATSTIKSPTHTYRNPGTYIVSLKVDNKKAWMATKQITVYDTVPTFVASDSVFAVYKDYTFTANLYNPYNYAVKYDWSFPLNTQYIAPSDPSATMDGSSITVYFTQALDSAPIWLDIIYNGDTVAIKKMFHVSDRTTNSLLLRTPNADYRQRIFEGLSEMYKQDPTAAALLDAEQDTTQTYNGHAFTLAEVATVFPEVEGFKMANRKIYFRAKGLWVANIDGAYPVQIDTVECMAITLDTHDNRIYWANKNGVWYMPFVGSDNNKFVSSPTLLNNLTDVSKLAPDYEER